MTDFAAPIAEQIWNMKYRFENEATVQDTWRRVANALAEPETDPNAADIFFDTLSDFKFLPGGRITAGAGTGRNVTLFNCFVMGTVPDSLDGIFDMLKEAALTMQQGGGIGYDFSTIRPKGAPVKGVGSNASGPLSFMDVWDAMCDTIMSAGVRRGAMMATMRCDHPDIKDFITAKGDARRLRKFNLSVLASDKFMEAVKADGMWDLVWEDEIYETVRARELWELIMRSTYDFAEPGVIFIDRINQQNNLNYCETISATNPCGEQPLPPYGACLLGSINLAKMVESPFTEDARINMELLQETVSSAVRMLDNVIDVSKFPLEKQAEEARNKRRIGLGVTGVADALAMVGVSYGSALAERALDDWLEFVAVTAYETSVDLAVEKGPFPLFDADGFLAPGTFAAERLPGSLKKRIKKHGVRNSHLLSIAPTGTISMYAGNVSSGIEPIFALGYDRKITQEDGSKTTERVEDYAVSRYPGEELPSYFVTTKDLTPGDHLLMQATAQKWVDSSISKTINLPEDISFDDFQEVYMDAYESGCKGCTTYRPNEITGSVLSVDEPKSEPVPVPLGGIADRPSVLTGRTEKIKWPGSPHAFYVTVNEENGRPREVFINTQSVADQPWITALTRMITAVYRRDENSQFVAKELQQIMDPKGGAWIDGQYVPSLIAAIGGVLEGGTETCASPTENEGAKCPECSGHMILQSGCATCQDCGHSKCG